MIVDDDDMIVSLLRHKLSQRGINVLSALNGEDALSLVQKEVPDLMILDGMMPGMDGIEVLQRIKNDARTASIRVVLLSARDSEADIVEALKAGADDYMVKPFRPEELWVRIQKMLGI